MTPKLKLRNGFKMLLNVAHNMMDSQQSKNSPNADSRENFKTGKRASVSPFIIYPRSPIGKCGRASERSYNKNLKQITEILGRR